MIFKDYYKILGLDDYKVSSDTIKQAYREQAKKYHPDTNNRTKSAEDRFRDINEAYKALMDVNSRKKYDRMWYSHIGKKKYSRKQKNKSIVNEVIDIFLGTNEIVENNNKKEKKIGKNGENIETEISISIIEAFYGKEKKISLKTETGKIKTLTINIPVGIKDKEKIKLVGQGKAGLNGGKSGDLIIKVNIESDNKYELKGSNIYTKLYLSPWEAALGTKVNFPTINEEISLYIPKGIQSGEKIEIKGKGYFKNENERGNLIATVCIMTPKNITKQEENIYKELQEVSKYNPREAYNI